ncbi:MAG: phosphoribosylglycinamide formyltransferase [Syntrophobacterales bacterium]|nr:phosphoribosylglycinamide formyltransferase [Syntrophobacterales bacterium]
MVYEKRLKLAIFISGSGTNLQSLLDRSSDGRLSADVLFVISDRGDAYGLERAKRYGVPSYIVDYRKHIDSFRHVSDRIERWRLGYRQAEAEMLEIFKRYEVDYIVLAGFMRLLTPYFLENFKTEEGVFRVLNIHPALLPAFPGMHGYEDTFHYGCRWGGVTVHFVDEGEDTGPIIAQAVYPIFPGDNLEDVRKRGLTLEYEIYAQCINWLASGMVDIEKIEKGKPKVTIKDPNYKDIIQKWIALAFGKI